MHCIKLERAIFGINVMYNIYVNPLKKQLNHLIISTKKVIYKWASKIPLLAKLMLQVTAYALCSFIYNFHVALKNNASSIVTC
jgi:hypothetical protein